MQHDVLAFPNLQDPVEALQDLVHERLFLRAEGFLGLDDNGLALEQRLEFAQAIGLERAAGRNQVADEIGAAEFGCNLDRAGEINSLGVDTLFLQKVI